MFYLWLGDEVEDSVRAGQLNLIDAFFKNKNLDLFQS
jgi:tmRNA-binding protein